MTSQYGLLDPIRFSVIIPLFNKEKSIRSTIESVLNQTYPNFELVLVNDGSTDNSLIAASSFNDTRIKILNKDNGGVSSARNRGIELSQNQYIVFLDADDLWLPYCLEEFCILINKFREAQVFCTNYNMTGKNLKGSERRYYIEDYFYTSAYYMAKWSIPIIITGCITIKRDIFIEVGYFNQNISHGEDIDMWNRLAKYSRIAKSEKVTTIYRTEAENRASHLDESLKLKQKQKQKQGRNKRNNVLNKSQRLYYGVQSVFELRSELLSGKITNIFKNERIYLNLIIQGLLYIIKVRVLKCPLIYQYSELN
jgi:glycosyltransferase involved in cell wall biosynthesis